MEIKNEKKVVGLDNDANAMKGSVWLYAPGNDEDGATVTSKYSKVKIDVSTGVDENNVKINVSMGDDKNNKKINVSMGRDENKEIYLVRKDKDLKEDKNDIILLYASGEEKIDVIVDGDNKEEDDVVDAFDDSNSKDIMFVYTSSIDKDVSGEDQNTVICYEDQAQ